jgi:hypothetical protein
VGFPEILTQIDREISQLKQARAVLASIAEPLSTQTPKKRNLTPEGRRRIAEAVKRRWAQERESKLMHAGGWVNETQSSNLRYQPSQI